MTALVIGALSVVVLSSLVAAAASRLQLKPRTPQKALPPPQTESAELRAWKQVFRETVISAEGELSPEMEEYLASDDERIARVLAQWRLQAEKEKSRLIEEGSALAAGMQRQARVACAEMVEKARLERAEILKEGEEWSRSRRPLLAGSAYAEYEADYAACKSDVERGTVIQRWHKKGFRFSIKLRGELMLKAGNEETRVLWRKMFDEQDADVVPADADKK